jgi:hypothetical protein
LGESAYALWRNNGDFFDAAPKWLLYEQKVVYLLLAWLVAVQTIFARKTLLGGDLIFFVTLANWRSG